MAMEYTQAQIDRQLNHPEETSTRGLAELEIAGLCIVEFVIALRMVARKLEKKPLHIDDFLLVVCAILVIPYCATGLIDLRHGYGHHTLTISKEDFHTRAKTGYINNILYTTTFPLSRISLVILYKRVFVKEWFRWTCWFLIGAYSCYSISTVFVDAFGVLPVKAVFDKSITPTHVINWRQLVFANCVFNITTDLILLALPLSVIWTLKTNRLPRIGLSLVFSLGVLILIAAIMRCYYSFNYDLKDPDYSTAQGAFWTVTEVYLGLLCPCLVTFHPLFVLSYRAVSSVLSPRASNRLARLTGVSPSGGASAPKSSSKTELKPYGSIETVGVETKRHNGDAASSRSGRGYDVEAGHGEDKEPFSLPLQGQVRRDGGEEGGYGYGDKSRNAALTGLDPRFQGQDLGPSARIAGGGDVRDGVPEQRLGVKREWQLESQRGVVGRRGLFR